MFTCRYCRRRLDAKDFEVDHITPVCRGGTDDPSNLCAACGDCNRGKGGDALDNFEDFCRLETDRDRESAIVAAVCRRFEHAKSEYAKELVADARLAEVPWKLIFRIAEVSGTWWDFSKRIYWLAGCCMDKTSVLAVVHAELLGDFDLPSDLPDPDARRAPWAPPVRDEDDNQSAEEQERCAQMGRDFLARLAQKGAR